MFMLYMLWAISHALICPDSYIYKDSACLMHCPSGFNLIGTSCFPGADLNLFETNFSDFTTFTTNIVDDFYTVTSDNFVVKGPYPTVNRGFYFLEGNLLISSQFIYPAPHFTLSLMFRKLEEGTIFEIKNSTHTYITISIDTSHVIFQISIIDKLTSNLILHSSQYSYTGLWHGCYFGTEINSDNLTLHYGYTGASSSITYIFSSPLELINPSFFLGGFQGFLYSVKAFNDWKSQIIPLSPNISTCFFDEIQPTCDSCTIFDAQWPGCVSQNNIKCYSENCNDCNSLLECSSCVDIIFSIPFCECGLDCIVCNDIFECLVCDVGFHDSDGICGISPNDDNLDIIFNKFESMFGGIWTNGEDGSTYFSSSYFNDQQPLDSFDPYIAKNRGLYFNGTMYMKNANPIILNHENSIDFWVYANKHGTIFSKATYTIFSDMSAVINLKSKSQSHNFYGAPVIPVNLKEWVYFSISVMTDSRTTTVSVLSKSSIYNIITKTGFAFYDDNIDAYLGCNTEKYANFSGFVYSMSIYQTGDIRNNSLYIGESCNLTNFGCAWSCDIKYYYNDFTHSYEECYSSCSLSGCTTWGSCNLCPLVTCEVCDDFTSPCISSSSFGCEVDFKLSPLNNCCHKDCLECNGPYFFRCSECATGFYQLGSVCYDNCPLGFSSFGNFCNNIIDPFFILDFNDITIKPPVTIMDTESNIVFSTTIDKSPDAIFNRGVYFRSDTFLTSPDLLFPHNFTWYIFIRPSNSGIIFSKSGIIFSYTSDKYFQLHADGQLIFKNNQDILWHSIKVSISYSLINKETYNVYIDTYALSAVTVNFVYKDNFSPMIIGSSSSGFTGFIWIIIMGLTASFIDPPIVKCLDYSQNNCYWDMDITKYFDGNIVDDCDIACINIGCRRYENCYMCEDELCVECLKYFDSCLKCIKNAHLISNKCYCNTHYYKDNTHCKMCSSACNDCYGPTDSECITCALNAEYNGVRCQCNNGYYLDSSGCEKCHQLCYTCNGPNEDNCLSCDQSLYLTNNHCVKCDLTCKTCYKENFYSCSSCYNKLLDVVCIPFCPIGYEILENECKVNKTLAVSYLFDGISQIYIDKVSSLAAQSGEGKTEYPDLNGFDPIPASFRGIYFTGNGSYLLFPKNREYLLFGISFYISIWLRPLSPDVGIMYKDTFSGNMFSVRVNENNQIQIIFPGEGVEYISSSKIGTENWNHVLISVSYKNATFVSVAINSIESYLILVSEQPLQDVYGARLYVGMSDFKYHYYEGFIYKLEIYLQKPEISDLLSKDCLDCTICEKNDCIPTCNIGEYNSSSKRCDDCLASCVVGCSNGKTCNLCMSKNCAQCPDYISNSCDICAENYELVNDICQACNFSSYYDKESHICRSCLPLCKACENEETCSSCKHNSILSSNSTCECILGYEGKDECNRKTFYAYIKINSDNVLTLLFSESLSRNLEISDLSIKINTKLQDFEIIYIDNSTFSININFKESVKSGYRATITFIKKLTSIKNAIISDIPLSILLFENEYSDIVKEVEKIREQTETIIKVIVPTMLGGSLFNLDPFSFFNFLNALEIYSYISLFNIDIENLLIVFMSCLSVNSLIPSIPAIFLSKSMGSLTNPQMGYFGFPQNLLMINSGEFLTMLMILLVTYGFVIISVKVFKNGKLARVCQKIFQVYTYGVFFRLWLQYCLEIGITSILSIKYLDTSNPVQIVDVVVCVFLIVIYNQIANLSLVVLLLYLVRKRVKLSGNQDLEEFLKKYGCFFGEFKTTGFSTWVVYPLFIVRRIVLIISIFFISSGIVQIVLSLITTLSVICI